MRFPFSSLALTATLLSAACGVGTSQSHGTQPPPDPQPTDAGLDADDANASCLGASLPPCAGCYGEPIDPECVDGAWQCPVLGCPNEIDAGCNGSPYPSCPAATGCEGPWTVECVGSQWTCVEQPSQGCPIDASTEDVVAEDAGPPFACGSVGCDPATSYCQVTTGGPVTDGGATGFECIALPSTCSPGAASCACIQAVQGIGCGCVESSGDVTVTCEIP